MIVAQKPTQSIAAPHTQSLAAPHWSLALPIRHPWKQQDVALPLVIPLGVEMVDKIAMMVRNDRVNFVSRSCRR
jgi:hypothetical protein